MKRVSLALTLLFALNVPITVFGATVGGVKFVNNIDTKSDYKVSSDTSKKVTKDIEPKGEVKEVFDENQGREINKLSKEYEYLINNNIVTRENSIVATIDGVKLEPLKENLNTPILHSDFLMGIYKSIYGTIDSRPIAFKTNSQREINGKNETLVRSEDYIPKDYAGEDKVFDFEGDFQVYISPNVHELYLSELLDLGIITEKEIKDKIFLEEYKNNSSESEGNMMYARWSNELPAYRPFEDLAPVQVTLLNSSPLGQGFNILNFDKSHHNKMDSFIATRNKPDFMVDERIKTIEALKYIEILLKSEEGDLSAEELQLASFKFGSPYLKSMDKEDQETVTFLLAKGILNFENKEEYMNLHDRLSTDLAYKIFYRIHDKSNRKDLKTIKLSEADKVWIDNGYTEHNLTLMDGTGIKEPTTTSIELMSDSFGELKQVGLLGRALSSIGFVVTERETKFNTPARDSNTWKVKKYFPEPEKAQYKGKAISDISTDSDTTITDVKDIEGGGKEVTFKSQAPSEAQALALIDSRITVTDGNSSSLGNLRGLSQLSGSGKLITYVSESELSQELSEIALINRKTLKNKVTGDTAILLDDNNVALIGNYIIRSESDMVLTINNETYYNMDFLIPLMTNAYISKLDPGKIYIKSDLVEETITPVEGSAGVIEQVPVIEQKSTEANEEKTYKMYDINMISRGLTTLIRDFDMKAADKSTKIRVIVDWSYCMPEDDTTIKEMSKQNAEDFSVKKASEFLFTQPSEGKLKEFWDNNYELSNGIANFMFGTSGMEYIKTGYLAPNITVLANDKKLDRKIIEANVLNEVKLSKSYLEKYADGSITNLNTKLFNGGNGDKTKVRTLRAFTNQGEDGIKAFYEVEGDDKKNLAFITTDLNKTYRSITHDSRIALDDNKIDITGRTPSTLSDSGVGTVVTFKEKKYYVDGFSQGGSYYMLTPIEPVEGKVKKLDNNKYDLLGEGDKSVFDILYDEVTKDMPTNYFNKPSDLKEKYPICNGTENLDNATFILEGNIASSGNNIGSDIPEKAKAFPALYLNRTEFVIDGGNMIEKKSHPYLQQGNIFYSGINSSVISRLLDNEMEVSTISRLPAGAKVIIQDVMYKVVGDSLVSEPITNQGFVNKVQTGVNSGRDDSVRSAILQLFNGLSIDYSGRPVSFTSYIQEADLGMLQDFKTADRTLYKDKGTAMIATKETDYATYKHTDVTKSVVVRIKPSSAITFSPIDKKERIYTIKYSTDKFSNGYIDNISMFQETLAFRAKDDLFLRQSKQRFMTLPNADKLLMGIRERYKLELREDWSKVIRIIIYGIGGYILFIGWATFIICTMGVGKPFFLMLKGGDIDNDLGFDAIRFFSFGIYSLDKELPFYELVIGNIIFATLMILAFAIL